jgi:hypothetical protein
MEVSTFLNQVGESDEFPDCLRSENFNDHPELDMSHLPPHEPLPALPVPKFVDCSDVSIASLNRKSRTAAFAFPLQPIGTEKNFVEGLASRITRMYTNRIPKSGFRIRHASYFCFEERMWLVLVSRDSLYFIKWNTIFRNLGAESIRVYYVDAPEERIGGRTSNGLVATLDMFPHLTIEELVDNSVNILKPLVGARFPFVYFHSQIIFFPGFPACQAEVGQEQASVRRVAAQEARVRRVAAQEEPAGVLRVAAQQDHKGAEHAAGQLQSGRGADQAQGHARHRVRPRGCPAPAGL